MDITIKLGKEGEEMQTSTLLIEGCSCRHDDFVAALVKFANHWVKDADAHERTKERREEILASARNGEKKPCKGCPEKNGG